MSLHSTPVTQKTVGVLRTRMKGEILAHLCLPVGFTHRKSKLSCVFMKGGSFATSTNVPLKLGSDPPTESKRSSSLIMTFQRDSSP